MVRSTVAAATDRLTRNHVRIVFLTILIACAAGIIFNAAGESASERTAAPADAPPTDTHTVITQSGRAGNILAYAPNGSRIYANDTHTKYYDVDPVENESMTVEYAATDTLYADNPRCQDPPCARNVIERAAILAGDSRIEKEHILFSFETDRRRHRLSQAPATEGSVLGLKSLMQEHEKQVIRKTLVRYPSIRQCAKALQLSHTALINKIKKYGLRMERK